jgi:hypothetical protein
VLNINDLNENATVAESVDAADLKSVGR